MSAADQIRSEMSSLDMISMTTESDPDVSIINAIMAEIKSEPFKTNSESCMHDCMELSEDAPFPLYLHPFIICHQSATIPGLLGHVMYHATASKHLGKHSAHKRPNFEIFATQIVGNYLYYPGSEVTDDM